MTISAGETYATLAESVAYAAAREWTDWAAASDATREAKLREGSDFISTAVVWPGELADLSQTLAWPRVYAYDSEGRSLTGTPTALKNANIEAARLALSGPLLGGAQDAQVVTRKKIGPLEKDYSTPRSQSDVRADRLAYVYALLRSVGAQIRGGSSVRLLKA